MTRTALHRFLRNCRWSWRRAVDDWIERNVVAPDHTEINWILSLEQERAKRWKVNKN